MLFVNLSNHHSSSWGKNQVVEAEKYGGIVDLDFPCIDPLATSHEIGLLAVDYMDKIVELLKGDTGVIHIMGESNFCFALITLLIKEGIDCLASTTHRNVINLPSGEKVVQFEFCQFRKY